MASNSTTINPEDVIAAVARDPSLRPVSPSRVEAYQALAALLPEAVGDRLDKAVSFQEYLTVQLDFLTAAAALEVSDNGVTDALLDSCGLNAGLIEDSLEDYYAMFGRSDPQDLLQIIGFTGELTALAIAGQLTYRMVLLKQPMVFIPQPQE